MLVNLVIIACGIAALIVVIGMDSLLHRAKTESRRFCVSFFGISALIFLVSLMIYTKLNTGDVNPNTVESHTSITLTNNVLKTSAASLNANS